MIVRESAGNASGASTVAEKVNPLDLAETEKRLITQALASTGGNITAAANQLGISRRTLHRKLNEMNAFFTVIATDTKMFSIHSLGQSQFFRFTNAGSRS